MIEVTNSWDIVCNICILILENLSQITGLSYGFLNIMIFVIIEPLIALLFMSSTITLFVKTQNIKRQRIIASILFILGILITIGTIMTIIIATLTLPFD